MEIKFVLGRNQTDKNRPATIYCRITLDGERAGNFSTFISIVPHQWNPKAQFIEGNDDEATAANERSISIRTELKKCLNELTRAEKPVATRIIKTSIPKRKHHR